MVCLILLIDTTMFVPGALFRLELCFIAFYENVCSFTRYATDRSGVYLMQ